MNTRRGQPTREPVRPVTPDTDSVELVDLTPVAPPRRSPGRLAFGAGAVLVIAALGAFATWPAPAPPAATPGASVAAISTPLPTATASPASTPRPRPSGGPVLTPAALETLGPTAWTRGELDAEIPLDVHRAWAVGDRFISLGQEDTGSARSFYLLTSPDGRSWATFRAPPAVLEFTGGAVVGDRLWFAASVSNVTDSAWQLIGTSDGESWESLGEIAVEGLSIDLMTGVARVGDRWLVTAQAYIRDGSDGGFVREHVLTSRDGSSWTESDVGVPDGASVGSRLAMRGNEALIVGGTYEPEGLRGFSATTRDGIDWSLADGALPASTSNIENLACGPESCVADVSITEDGEPDFALLVTHDGLTWATVTPDPMFDDGTVRPQTVTATSAGFLVTGDEPGDVWFSPDGETWRQFTVMPGNQMDPPHAVAVKGDVILGLMQNRLGFTGTWLGSIGALAE